MNIKILEDHLDNISDKQFVPIIELIINSVNDYPVNNIDESEAYFQEVKRLLGKEDITYTYLKDYFNEYQNKKEKNVWVQDSINSLLEAFDLMQLYNIPFHEVIAKIEGVTNIH